jgi:hypothetical protein
MNGRIEDMDSWAQQLLERYLKPNPTPPGRYHVTETPEPVDPGHKLVLPEA